MALFDEQKEDEQDSEEQGSGKYLGLIIGVGLLPVLMFFDHIGRSDMGMSAFVCLGANILAVGICWELRKRLWFWGVIALVLALHVPLVLMIQWPDRWVSRFTLLPIGIADLLITVGVVRFVETFIVKSSPPDEEE
jgi:hypothetical protein